MDDDVKFLKKNIRVTGLEVHPSEKAIVVQYELEAAILGTLGDRMTGERRLCHKIIRLKDLNSRTDVGALAREVLAKCRLIPAHRLAEVEQLVYYMQQRRPAGGESPGGAGSAAANHSDSSLRSDLSGGALTPVGGRASINKLDDYIETLYEEVPDKVRGTALILQLARNADNLEELLSNETLLGALARVLREDWKKNYDLAINIAYTFFCFSTFSQFHSMISHFKIGALCVQILEFELRRHDTWQEEMVSKGDVAEKARIEACLAKQETLMRVCIYLLMHLSEDVKVEVKMVNRGIVEILCKTLERRRNSELLVMALTFLKKLSVYRENKDRMAASLVVERACSLLPTREPNVSLSICGLLFNASFDGELRRRTVKAAGATHAAQYLASGNAALQEAALKLLYHLSMEDECKALLTYTDCIPVCMRLALSDCDASAAGRRRLAVALLANVAVCKRNAQLIAGERAEAVGMLVEAAYERGEPMLLKVVRNVAWADDDGGTRPALAAHCARLCATVTGGASALQQRRTAAAVSTDPGALFAMEALGAMAELRGVDTVQWDVLLDEHGLGDMVVSCLQPDRFDDDILLQVVLLLGAIAQQERGADALMRRPVVNALIDLLSAKQEDDDIVLQIVYVFYQLMFHDASRTILLDDTQVPAYLIDLMNDKNVQIRNMCDGTLEVIAEAGEDWARRIGEERFRWHNAQWLQMVGANDGAQQRHGEPDAGVAAAGGGGAEDETRFALDEDDEPELFGACHAEDVLDDLDSSERSVDRPQARIDYR